MDPRETEAVLNRILRNLAVLERQMHAVLGELNEFRVDLLIGMSHEEEHGDDDGEGR